MKNRNLKKDEKLDWNLVGELMKPVIQKRKKFFKTGMVLMIGINGKGMLEGIRIESHSFDEDGEPERNAIEIKGSRKNKEQLSYIG